MRQENMEQIRCFQTKRTGVAAGMAAKPFCIRYPPLHGQSDPVLRVVHQTQHRCGADLYAEQIPQVLLRGKTQPGGADDFGKIRRAEWEIIRHSQQIKCTAVARSLEQVLADTHA